MTEKQFTKLYLSKTNKEVAEKLNCTVQTVINYAKKLNLSKKHAGNNRKIKLK